MAEPNEPFDALVDQLRSLLLSATRSRDEAVRRLEEESQQLDQERSQIEQERLAMRQEITRLQQLVSDQARDLNILAQVENERAVLEEQCAALRQEVDGLQASQGAELAQNEQAKSGQRTKAAPSRSAANRSAPGQASPETGDAERAQPAKPSAPPGVADPAVSQSSRDSRRIAMPCMVVIHRADFNDEVEGWAVERSLEGLAILLDEKYPVGTPLRVRSAKSARGTWLDIVVEACQAERANFRVQCTFASPVTWADIQHLAG
jgi:hypothetical protein